MRFRLRTLLIAFLLLALSVACWKTFYQHWSSEYYWSNSPIEFNGPKGKDVAREEHMRQVWGRP